MPLQVRTLVRRTVPVLQVAADDPVLHLLAEYAIVRVDPVAAVIMPPAGDGAGRPRSTRRACVPPCGTPGQSPARIALLGSQASMRALAVSSVIGPLTTSRTLPDGSMKNCVGRA